jgi:hypothetical protein
MGKSKKRVPFLTDAEMKEYDDLLNRYNSLSPDEMKRFEALDEQNEESLQPELGILFELLSYLDDNQLLEDEASDGNPD